MAEVPKTAEEAVLRYMATLDVSKRKRIMIPSLGLDTSTPAEFTDDIIHVLELDSEHSELSEDIRQKFEGYELFLNFPAEENPILFEASLIYQEVMTRLLGVGSRIASPA